MHFFPRSMIVVAVATLIPCAAETGMAQQTTDQIIADLRLRDDLSGGLTRGIRHGSPLSASSPAIHHAHTAPSNLPPRVTDRSDSGMTHAPGTSELGPAVNVTVNFPTGSSTLTATAQSSLDALGRALASNELANFRFRIEGHTDNVGSPEENLTLSRQRAAAVVAYFTNRYGISPSRLEATGMGQEHPLIETPPQTPEARNRRVQVINMGS